MERNLNNIINGHNGTLSNPDGYNVPFSNNIFIQKGWECPKCGRVYSPTTPMCLYCGKHNE